MPKIKGKKVEKVETQKDVEKAKGTNGEAVHEPAQPVAPTPATAGKKGKGRPRATDPASEGGSTDERPVLYPEVVTAIYAKGYPEPAIIGPHEGEMTAARMKELLGWTEVGSDELNYDLKDAFGTKVRLINNYGNRPYSKTLAEDWKLEVLKKHWRLNGETIVIGRHGMIISGQHRGVGLVLAVQEWSKPTSRMWHDFWGVPGKGGVEPTMPVVVVYGVAEDDETVNTVDTGRPRSGSDALYRSEMFKMYPHHQRRQVARAMEFAVRTLWDRTCQTDKGYVPRRLHSDMFDFIDSHKKIREAVEFCFRQNIGETRKSKNDKNVPQNLISRHIGVGVASGLLYLMGASKSDRTKYETQRKAHNASQRYLDMGHWDTAKQFWSAFAEASRQYKGDAPRTSPLLVLISALEAERVDGRAADLDKRVALIVKAWHSYLRNEGEVHRDDLELTYKVHPGSGIRYFDDYPEIGGIDTPNREKVKALVEKFDKADGSDKIDDIDGHDGFTPDSGDVDGEPNEDTSEGDD